MSAAVTSWRPTAPGYWADLETHGKRCSYCGRKMDLGERVWKQKGRRKNGHYWREENRTACMDCSAGETEGAEE